MDSSDNKEQAVRCVKIAQKAMEDKDWSKVSQSTEISSLISIFINFRRPNAFSTRA